MTGPGRRDGYERCTVCGSADLFSGFWDAEGYHDEEHGKYGTVCQQCGHLQFRRKPRTQPY